MKIMNSIKKRILYVSNLVTFLKYEFKNSSGLFRFIKTGTKGFYSSSSALYDFEKNDSKEYVSDWMRLHKISRINGNRKLILDDMLLFHLFNKNNPKIPKLIAITQMKRVFEVSDIGFKNEITMDELLEKTKSFKHGVILKSQLGGGGHNISKVQFEDNDFKFSGSCKSFDELKKAINSNINFIITEIIKQTGFASEVYPGSLNTMRLLTMNDPVTNRPFIAKATQRFGTVDSGILDNFDAGGISVDINLKEGTYGLGAIAPKNTVIDWIEVHPNTKVKFHNVKVPNFNMIKAGVLEISSEYFFLPYIGWDIVPMEDGFLVLEGNTNSGMGIQLHGGLLTNERVKDFYKYHNVYA